MNNNNTIMYKKNFETFKEGLETMINLVPMIKEYISIDNCITDESNTDSEIQENATKHLIKKLSDNMPVVSNPNYPYTYSMSLESFNLFFRTDKRLGFGWKINADFENEKVTYVMRVSFPNSAEKSKCEYDLLKNGWILVKFRPNNRNRFNSNPKFNNKPNNINTPAYTKNIKTTSENLDSTASVDTSSNTDTTPDTTTTTEN